MFKRISSIQLAIKEEFPYASGEWPVFFSTIILIDILWVTRSNGQHRDLVEI